MIFLHCAKPKFIGLPVCPPIYRSKSAKFQLCTTVRIIIIFMRTALPYLFFVFCFLFLNPEAEIMLNVLFNTLLTITPHNTQKRRRRKERTTYGPLRRSGRGWLTHPVLNPDRPGLTWLPLPNRVSRGLFCLRRRRSKPGLYLRVRGPAATQARVIARYVFLVSITILAAYCLYKLTAIDKKGKKERNKQTKAKHTKKDNNNNGKNNKSNESNKK